MNQQLILPLALRASTQFSDYVAGDNQMLLDALHQQRAEREHALIYLSGEFNSGRTHLLMAQSNAAEAEGLHATYLPCDQLIELQPDILKGLEQADLLAIDDVHLLAGEPAWEQSLFHLFNRAKANHCRLLFSAAQRPADSNFLLPDLSSRLSWGLVYRLKPLNDLEREQLLINLGARHGLTMPTDVAHYLVQRQPRDMTHLIKLVERLDQASLQEQRCLTVPFVRKHMPQA